MIKNIIFDMGGVLMQWSPATFIDRYDLSDDDKTLLMNVVFRDYRWPLLDYGYYATEEDFLTDVLTDLPERLHPVARALASEWDKPTITSMPGMADLIKQLKDNGYGIYLLSNAGPRHKEYWPKVAGSEYFDGVVVSAYEKQYKPGTEIFRTILDRYNLVPEECVFTDDLPTNCAGAFLCGIHPIVFRSPQSLKAELLKLGVRI